MSLDSTSEREEVTMESQSNHHRYSLALVVIAIFSAITLSKSIEETTEALFEEDVDFSTEDYADYGWDDSYDSENYEETAYEEDQNVFAGLEDKDPYGDSGDYDEVDYATEPDVESDTSEATITPNSQDNSSPQVETVQAVQPSPNTPES